MKWMLSAGGCSEIFLWIGEDVELGWWMQINVYYFRERFPIFHLIFHHRNFYDSLSCLLLGKRFVYVFPPNSWLHVFDDLLCSRGYVFTVYRTAFTLPRFNVISMWKSFVFVSLQSGWIRCCEFSGFQSGEYANEDRWSVAKTQAAGPSKAKEWNTKTTRCCVPSSQAMFV
jgi:hypothetical protein